VSVETGSAPFGDQARHPELDAALREVAERIARHRGAHIGEQNTKLTLVNPALRALGWNVEDLEDVRHEFRRVPSDKPVDYALLLARTPRLFVEAKALDENLEDRRWANQIISYAAVAGVEWVVLTNGDEYRIYNAHAPVPVEDKLFRSVQVSADLEAAAEALALLSKEQTQEKSLGALWQAYSVDRRVKDAVEALFAPEPDRWLVRRIARDLDGLTPGDVRTALNRSRIMLDFPARELPRSSRRVGRTDDDLQRAEDTSVTVRPARRRRVPVPEAVSTVTVGQLISAGLIKPPLQLTRTYKGRKLFAQIEPDGRVSCLGEIYGSVSVAGGFARRSVIGAPPGRKYPQTNGWTFWQFRDHDGRLRELTVLRERFVTGEGAGAE
jgi:hypothetical protein